MFNNGFVQGKVIRYCGKLRTLVCDMRCEMAWGMNSRPKRMLSQNEDDYIYLSDDELLAQGLYAPSKSPCTEGGDNKPLPEEQKFNRWCARECERSIILDGTPLDMTKPIPNIPR